MKNFRVYFYFLHVSWRFQRRVAASLLKNQILYAFVCTHCIIWKSKQKPSSGAQNWQIWAQKLSGILKPPWESNWIKFYKPVQKISIPSCEIFCRYMFFYWLLYLPYTVLWNKLWLDHCAKISILGYLCVFLLIFIFPFLLRLLFQFNKVSPKRIFLPLCFKN
jgi:hypothetical protein